MSTPLRRLLLLALVCTSALGTGCSSGPEKRILQYLNRDGFGKRYVGNAEEENYISLGDEVQILDTLHPDELQASAPKRCLRVAQR